MRKGVIFDIDGTLFDTGEGIKACVRHALAAVGAPPLSQDKLDSFIGPSLFHSFTVTAGLDEERAQQAVDAYRAEYFPRGVDKALPYRGVSELLADLFRDGYVLSVASSKPLIMVNYLLEKFDYKKYFAAVVAPDYARRGSDKAELIRAAAVADKSVMVGDTVFDIDGARGAGVPVIAALYGYGAPETLVGADALADSPARVREIAESGTLF